MLPELALKPKALFQFLVTSYKARAKTLVVGPPGMGKTALSKQAAKEAGMEIVVSHPATWDPVINTMGLPGYSADGISATFYQLGTVRQILNATIPTIWFWDDLGQTSEDVQKAMMQWAHGLELNGLKIPDCVTIAGATNRRTDRAGVKGLIEPLKSRFDSIVNLEPSIEDLSDHFLDIGADEMVIAFIRTNAGVLEYQAPTSDLVNTCCPRTLESLSKLVRADYPDEMKEHAYAGAIGREQGNKFFQFERLRHKVNLDALLLDPQQYPIPEEPTLRWFTVISLARRTTIENFEQICTYAKRLHAQGATSVPLAVLLVRECTRTCRDVVNTKAFVHLQQTEMAKVRMR